MKQPGKLNLFAVVCIAVLLGAYGVGLGIRKVRFTGVEEQVSADVKPEKLAGEPEEEAVAANENAEPESPDEPEEEVAQQQEAEEPGPRPQRPEGRRMMGGEMIERFQHTPDAERARMELEVARAQLDQENYGHVQEIWPTMSEEERDSYRAQSLELFGRGQSSGGER